jgi:AraC-like DNA-binding protein
LKRGQPCPEDYRPRNIQFAPADVRLWGYCADSDYIKDVTLVFADPALGTRLDERIQLHRQAPRLRFADDRIWGPMKLLADAVGCGEPIEPLWAEHLVLAVVARLEGLAADPTAQRGLAPWRLRRALTLIEERSPDRVSMDELAAEVGLSQAHFARAFKASTGLAPYQWQMRARIGRAKAMLESGEAPIEEIALAMGFADAGHFARRFRSLVGASPAAWRRDRKG